MIVVITSLELKNIWLFFGFANEARKIVGQLKSANHKGFKSKGLGKTHYTISIWPDEQTKNTFYRSGAHAKAMGKSAKYAREIRTYTYKADQMPEWAEAKKILHEKGKVLSF